MIAALPRLGPHLPKTSTYSLEPTVYSSSQLWKYTHSEKLLDVFMTPIYF